MFQMLWQKMNFRNSLVSIALNGLKRGSFFVFLLLLSGCGFQPLNAPLMQGGDNLDSYVQKYHQIKIAPIPDRSGQILRNFLIDLLTPKGVTQSKYILNVTLDEEKGHAGFRKNFTARQVKITLKAQVSLVEIESNKTLFTENLRVMTSYSLGATSQFASFSGQIAEQTTRERALKLLADQIKLLVAHHFNRPQDTSINHENKL